MTQSPTRVGITSKLPGQLNCFIFFYWSLTVTVTVKEKLNEILCQNECGGKTKESFTDFPQSSTFDHHWSSFLLLPIAMLIGQCLRDEGVLMWAGRARRVGHWARTGPGSPWPKWSPQSTQFVQELYNLIQSKPTNLCKNVFALFMFLHVAWFCTWQMVSFDQTYWDDHIDRRNLSHWTEHTAD